MGRDAIVPALVVLLALHNTKNPIKHFHFSLLV